MKITVDRDAYVDRCRARWSGPALRDAIARWPDLQGAESILGPALRRFAADPLQRDLGGGCHCDGTLTDFLWKLQAAVQPDKRCLLPFLDFEERYQKVFLRRGLLIWCGLYLDSLRAACVDLPLFPNA